MCGLGLASADLSPDLSHLTFATCCPSFQKKVEMFHEAVQSGVLANQQDRYVVKTIALVNCCPPLRWVHAAPRLMHHRQIDSSAL